MNSEKDNQDNFERHKIGVPAIEKKLGDAKRHSKNYDEALFHYKNSLIAIKLLFDEEGALDEEKATNLIEKIAIPVHLNMAFCRERKDWENIISNCNKVLEIKNKDTKAIHRRCKAYTAMGIKAINSSEKDFEYLNDLMRKNDKPEIPLKDQDLILLNDLERQLDRFRLEREANNVFGSIQDSNTSEECLEEEDTDKDLVKNNLVTKHEEKPFIEKENHDENEYEIRFDAEMDEIKGIKSTQEIIEDKIECFFNYEILDKSKKGLIENLSVWELIEKIAIFFSSNSSRKDLLTDHYRLKFNNYLEEIENKYIPREGKFRYAVDSTITIAKKFRPHTDTIKNKCLRTVKKCCSFPVNMAQKQIDIIYSIICFIFFFMKNSSLKRKDQKNAKDIAYLKSE